MNGPVPQPPSLTGFFTATFLVTWVFWIPAALMFDGRLMDESPFSMPLLIVLQTLGAASPSVVAYALLRRSGSRAAPRTIARRYGQWRVGVRWYLAAAFLVPAIQLAGLLAGGALQGGATVDPTSPLGEMLENVGYLGAVAVFPVMVLAQLPSSPLLEEFGWRGFALPRLQAKYSALTSGVILGLLWGIWHLPLTIAYGDPLAPFLLKIVAVSILITWIFNHTKGSLLIAMLCHASLNASIVPLSTDAGRWPSVFLALAVAATVVVINGGRDLARVPRFRWSTPIEEKQRTVP